MTMSGRIYCSKCAASPRVSWGFAETALKTLSRAILHSVEDHDAAGRAKTAVVQLLAALNEDKPDAVRLDELDDDRKPPLILAPECRYDSIVRVLFSYSGKKNARDMAGMTVLAHAAKRGCSPEVDRLLANGAGQNLKDNENATRLLWASCRNKEPIVRQLLALDDLEMDSVDYENMTAFSWAIERRYAGIASCWLEDKTFLERI
jgi:ankyrin repeat protein